MLKKIISIVLAVMMTVSCTFMDISTVTAAEYIASGDWEQCHWAIDSNGKLTISGTIPSNSGWTNTAWDNYNEKIKEVYAKPNTRIDFLGNCFFDLQMCVKM